MATNCGQMWLIWQLAPVNVMSNITGRKWIKNFTETLKSINEEKFIWAIAHPIEVVRWVGTASKISNVIVGMPKSYHRRWSVPHSKDHRTHFLCSQALLPALADKAGKPMKPGIDDGSPMRRQDGCAHLGRSIRVKSYNKRVSSPQSDRIGWNTWTLHSFDRHGARTKGSE